MSSTSEPKKVPLEQESVILTSGFIDGQGDEADVLFDTGSAINVVSQRFVVERELQPLDGDLPSPQLLSGNSVYCYGAHKLRVVMTDDWGQKSEVESIFYALDTNDTQILLGMPGLRTAGVHLDCGERKWRFQITPERFTLDDPHTFAKILDAEPVVYAVVVSKVLRKPHVKRDRNYKRRSRIATVGIPSFPPHYKKRARVFSDIEAGKLPPFKEGDHALDLVDGEEPPYGPLYNLSQRELKVLREYLDNALLQGLIRHSTSPAGAPVLFVPKKDGGLRLCVDYRGLNKITIKNRHPLPLISETLDRLVGAKIFTKLDLKDAFNRLRIKKGDEWKTAFRTRYGHFEYLVMPFGLANAPASFQAYINKALAGFLDTFCVVYLDDILIYSQNQEEHIKHVDAVLQRLDTHSLFVNLKKCVFHTTEVEFLGFIVSTNGVRMDERRVASVRDWPIPHTFREVQVFLGFANFYRRFITSYSKVAAPITELLKGSTKGKKLGTFEWTKEAQEAFEKLKELFTSAPMLVHYNPSLRNRLETDASAFALAAIFTQLQDDQIWHPVAFWSRKMIPAETRYEVHDQELLAIVEAFKHWRHYLEGALHPVEVLTDHNNLRGFMNVKQLNGRQARWAVRLSAFDFVINHRAGKTNPADAPSRRPDYHDDTNKAVERLLPTLQKKLSIIATLSLHSPLWNGLRASDLPPLGTQRTRNPQTNTYGNGGASIETPITIRNVAVGLNPVAGTNGCKHFVPRSIVNAVAVDETAYDEITPSMFQLITDLQKVAPFITKKREELDRKSKRGRRAARRSPWNFRENGLLYHENALFVPEDQSVRAELMRRHHDDDLAGHFGVDKTKDLLRRKYYWIGINDDVSFHCSTCDVCQRINSRHHKPYGLLSSLPWSDKPWDELTMDFITGLPPSKVGTSVYDSILVIVDRCTKMAQYLPCTKTITASKLADLFFDQVVTRFGTPSGIVSDRGAVFTSGFWSDFCYYMKTKRRLSTAFHPQTDGQTERQNQTLEHFLRAFCNEEQNDWAELLRPAEFAYNNAEHSTLGCSPFYAYSGHNPNFRFDVAEDDSTERGVPAVHKRVLHIKEVREAMAQRWKNAVESQAKYYDAKHEERYFCVGDKVMLSTKNLKLKRPSKKLTPKFIGPFRVKDVVGRQAYELFLPNMYSRLHPVFPVTYLEPYKERPNDSSEPDLPMPDLADENAEYEVEEIVDRRVDDGVLQYCCKFKGWDETYNEFVDADDLDAEKLVQAYEQNAKPKRKRGRPRKKVS